MNLDTLKGTYVISKLTYKCANRWQIIKHYVDGGTAYIGAHATKKDAVKWVRLMVGWRANIIVEEPRKAYQGDAWRLQA